MSNLRSSIHICGATVNPQRAKWDIRYLFHGNIYLLFPFVIFHEISIITALPSVRMTYYNKLSRTIRVCPASHAEAMALFVL